MKGEGEKENSTQDKFSGSSFQEIFINNDLTPQLLLYQPDSNTLLVTETPLPPGTYIPFSFPGWRQGPWDRQRIRQNIAQSTILLYVNRAKRSSPTGHLWSCKGGKPCSGGSAAHHQARWAQGSQHCKENKCNEAGHGMVQYKYNLMVDQRLKTSTRVSLQKPPPWEGLRWVTSPTLKSPRFLSHLPPPLCIAFRHSSRVPKPAQDIKKHIFRFDTIKVAVWKLSCH